MCHYGCRVRGHTGNLYFARHNPRGSSAGLLSSGTPNNRAFVKACEHSSRSICCSDRALIVCRVYAVRERASSSSERSAMFANRVETILRSSSAGFDRKLLYDASRSSLLSSVLPGANLHLPPVVALLKEKSNRCCEPCNSKEKKA